MLVLDTHIWIWLMAGDQKIIDSGYLSHIKKAIKSSSIKIPSISLWEVSMLNMKGRISLSENILAWLKKALSAPGISLSPLTPEIAADISNLPEEFHGDPADRIIISTTRVLSANLLTFDKKILSCASNGYVKVIRPK